MNNQNIKFGVLITSLLLLFKGIGTLYAQTLELEIIGGGFKLRGPESISFETVQTSFSEQNTQIKLRTISIENKDEKTIEEGGITIIDESGGRNFSLSVSASDLRSNEGVCEGESPYYNCISAQNFQIRNWDQTEESIVTKHGTTEDITLHTSTEDFTSINTQKTLVEGSGRAPGMWKIFPELKIIIPAGQNSGNYSGTLGFTIT